MFIDQIPAMWKSYRECRCLSFILATAVIFFNPGQGQQFGQVEFRIQEQLPSGTNVGSLRDKARITEKVPAAELSSLSFKFLNPNNLLQTASLFSINSDNGAVYTTAMIDRESVCQFQKTCHVEFEVTVTSAVSKFFEIVSVRVIIEDINDNAPRFPNDEVTLYVSESVNVHSEFRIAGAMDKDTSEDNSVRRYELKSDYGDMFELKSEMKLDWTWDLSIVILKPLDRESKDHYQLVIVARDNGSPPRSGNVTVHINVTDTNDNPPVFTENTYEVSVSEQAEVGAVVGQVWAVDADKGMNSAVTYRFSPARSSLMEDLFYIDPHSGEVKVKSDLQYEAGKSFETIVVASDKGNPPRAAQAVLIIKVIDVGNTPPRISINPVPNPEANVLSLSEASPLETVVAHVRTDDRDSGVNGVVDCFSASPKFRVRRFEGSGFLVELSEQLDREVEEELNLTIVCEDRGQPKLSARGWFIIKVLDANDNEPVFTKTIYQANLTENNKKGERVLTVKAFDKDIGENAQIRYSISVDGSEPSFVIDPETGEIRAGQVFDRETVSQVSFVVMAEDGGQKRGKTSVVVNILDQNDNSPYISSSLEFQVAERLKAGSVVDSLVAVDRDEGFNAKIFFTIPNVGFSLNTNIPFVVSDEGVIKTTRELDKDKQSLFHFPVVVRDNGFPSRSSSATVTVHVIDSNDHRPVFVYPSRSNNTVRVRSDILPGSLIAILSATDEDVGRNGRLRYSIVSGNHDRVFVMPDPSSGEVRLTNDSDLLYSLQTHLFRLNVSVRDQGIPVLEAHSVLHVQVEFVEVPGAESRASSSSSSSNTFRRQHDGSRTRPGGGASASSMEGEDVKYIIIAGVVGGATVVISIIIVTIILLMRRPDSGRNLGVAGVQEQGDGRHFDKLSWQSVPAEEVPRGPVCHQKSGGTPLKGVEGSSLMETKPCNGSLRPDSDLVDVQNRKFSSEAGQGPQQLLTFKKFALRPPTDDHQSDTSGETATSDSGRGGSEEDIQLPPLPELCEDVSGMVFRTSAPSLKDTRFLHSSHPDARQGEVIAFQTFARRIQSPPPDARGILTPTGIETYTPGGRVEPTPLRRPGSVSPQVYSPYPSPSHPQLLPLPAGRSAEPASGTGKKVTFKSDLTAGNLRTWDLSQHHAPSPVPHGYHSSERNPRRLTSGRAWSQEEDDNTTTSGSYSLNPEDDLEDVSALSLTVSS